MQNNPFPVYPGRQEQEYEPSVLAQLAYEWHSCGPLHSSTSESTKHWEQFYHGLAGKLVKESPDQSVTNVRRTKYHQQRLGL